MNQKRNVLRESNNDWREEKNFENEFPLSRRGSDAIDERKWRRNCIGRIDEVRIDALERGLIDFEWFWDICSTTHRR